MKKKQLLLVLLSMTMLFASCGKESDDRTRTRASKNTTDASVETEDSSDTNTAAPISMDSYTNNNPLIPRDQLPYSGTEYVYDDISIVFPDSWDGKYQVQESDNNDGFAVIQTASYNVDESGFLFYIQKSDKLDYILNGHVIAYTPEYVYTIEFPTDVSYVYDDDEISEEYQSMFNDIKVIENSLFIAEDDVNYKVNEYILPGSDYFVYSESNLEEFSYNDLVHAKQEIYARHGMNFESTGDGGWYFQSYFDGLTWYEDKNATVSYDDLSKNEQENLDNIEKELESKEASFPYCQIIYDGETISVDIDGDGASEEISYYDNGPENGHDLYFHPVISIDGEEYQVWDQEQYGVWMDDVADHCYLVEVDKYSGVYALAILDYGPSDDEVTDFFVYKNDTLVNSGYIPGFCFSPDSVINGFGGYGITITGVATVWLPETSSVYACYSYNPTEDSFEDCSAEYVYKYSREHELLQDLEVSFRSEDRDYTYTFKKGENVYFISTDQETYLKLKNEDGVIGYINIGSSYGDDEYLDMDSNTGEKFTDIFEGLVFAG